MKPDHTGKYNTNLWNIPDFVQFSSFYVRGFLRNSMIGMDLILFYIFSDAGKEGLTTEKHIGWIKKVTNYLRV